MTMDYSAALDSVRSRLLSLQGSNAAPITVFKHDRTGLGAQISRRLLALRIANLTGRRSVFIDEVMRPYSACYQPLSAAPYPPFKWEELPTLSSELDSPERICKFDFWSFWADEARRESVLNGCPRVSGNSGLDALAFDGMLFSTTRLLPEFAQYVAHASARLGLDGVPYIGLHYRRGDKKAETPYVPTDVYRAKVAAEAEASGLRNVYVASDSPHALEELQLEKLGLTPIFDSTERRYNNANHRFIAKNSELALEETRTAIKNIYLLSAASRVVGQTNAHFATLAASALAYRNALSPTLIPGEIRLTSRLTKIHYSTKNVTKEFVKKMLPRLTVRGR